MSRFPLSSAAKNQSTLVLSTVRSTMKSDHQMVKEFVNFVLPYVGK